MKKGLIILLILGGLLAAGQEYDASKIKGTCLSYMSEYSVPGYYLGYRFNDDFEILAGYSNSKGREKNENNSSLRKENYEEKIEAYGIKYYFAHKDSLHIYLGAFTLQGSQNNEYEYTENYGSYSYNNSIDEKINISGNKFCIGAQYFLNSDQFAFNIEYGAINKKYDGSNEDEDKVETDIEEIDHQTYTAFGISCYF